jgi:hypothetical protein
VVELIAVSLQFVKDQPISQIDDRYKDFDIADIPWRKLIKAQQIIEAINRRVDPEDKEAYSLELICASADIAEALTGEDFKAKRTTDAFWCVDFFLRKLAIFRSSTALKKAKKKIAITLN